MKTYSNLVVVGQNVSTFFLSIFVGSFDLVVSFKSDGVQSTPVVVEMVKKDIETFKLPFPPQNI